MKRLVLVGGGHSQIEVLRRLAAQPCRDLDTVLLTPQRHAIYTGMIPGVVAGDYVLNDSRIDLAALAHRAGARVMLDAACGLDAGRRCVLTSGGESLAYDLLSLDVGSEPAEHGIAGVAEHAVKVKPAEEFLQGLGEFDEPRAARQWNEPPTARQVDEPRGARQWDEPRGARQWRHVAVVGAGAAGIEIAFTLWHRLNRDRAGRAQITLVSESAALLPGFDAGTRRSATRIAARRNIALQLGAAVIAVDAKGLALAGGARIQADTVIWVAGPAALPWLRATPLATDAGGYVVINDCLQSVSHPEVFASGDCAGNAAAPKPKSGVFAVRQGPVLTENLLRAARGEPLLAFKSSSSALAILNCGGRHALASWHGYAFKGRWVWIWKDWLDRRFVRRYRGSSD